MAAAKKKTTKKNAFVIKDTARALSRLHERYPKIYAELANESLPELPRDLLERFRTTRKSLSGRRTLLVPVPRYPHLCMRGTVELYAAEGCDGVHIIAHEMVAKQGSKPADVINCLLRYINDLDSDYTIDYVHESKELRRLETELQRHDDWVRKLEEEYNFDSQSE